MQLGPRRRSARSPLRHRRGAVRPTVGVLLDIGEYQRVEPERFETLLPRVGLLALPCVGWPWVRRPCQRRACPSQHSGRLARRVSGRCGAGRRPRSRREGGHPGCRAGRIVGRGEIAQLVEHTTENRSVLGSIPSLAIGPWWSRGFWTTTTSGCPKPAGIRGYPPVSRPRPARRAAPSGRRNPCKAAILLAHSLAPQSQERTPENRGVPGSNPGLAMPPKTRMNTGFLWCDASRKSHAKDHDFVVPVPFRDLFAAPNRKRSPFRL
jgi:hypothetical protein